MCPALKIPEPGAPEQQADEALVDHGAGAADADRRGGDFFPAVAAADAVGGQADGPLEPFQSTLGVAAEDAVQRAGGVAEGVADLSINTTENL